MGKIVAIGGYIGNGGSASMKSLPIDKEIIRLSGKKHPRALFIPTAAEDSEKYVRWFEEMYGRKLKCKTDTLLLYKTKLARNEIAQKILSADIIFVGGGNTLKMMLRWKRFGVDKCFGKPTNEILFSAASVPVQFVGFNTVSVIVGNLEIPRVRRIFVLPAWV